MTKDDAQKAGFCDRSAAFTCGQQLCGILAGKRGKALCQLDLETQQRWRAETGGGRLKFGRKTA